MPRSLIQLLQGETGHIVSFLNDQIAGRFLAMGVLPGSRVEVVRVGPLAGGYYLKVDGRKIGVRKGEAASIVVK